MKDDLINTFLGVSRTLKPKDLTQAKYLMLSKGGKTERFYDADNDSVPNGLDCYMNDGNRHGFWSKTGNFLRGRGFSTSEDIEKDNDAFRAMVEEENNPKQKPIMPRDERSYEVKQKADSYKKQMAMLKLQEQRIKLIKRKQKVRAFKNNQRQNDLKDVFPGLFTKQPKGKGKQKPAVNPLAEFMMSGNTGKKKDNNFWWL